MNPLILGILALGGIILITAMYKTKVEVYGAGGEKWTPFAGFYGGGGGTIEEKPLLPY